MDELRKRMATTGMSKEDIDAELFYNPSLFKGCVDRHVPRPSVLYWRVRAVFVTFGNMIDESTGRPLFNDAAWKKARNILKEIRAGLYSDPPGMRMYTYKMEKGKVKLNKYGMKMIECIRGTNRRVKDSLFFAFLSSYALLSPSLYQDGSLSQEPRHSIWFLQLRN